MQQGADIALRTRTALVSLSPSVDVQRFVDGSSLVQVHLTLDKSEQFNELVRLLVREWGAGSEPKPAASDASFVITVECNYLNSIVTYFLPNAWAERCRALARVERVLAGNNDGEFHWRNNRWVSVYEDDEYAND